MKKNMKKPKGKSQQKNENTFININQCDNMMKDSSYGYVQVKKELPISIVNSVLQIIYAIKQKF